MSITYFKTGGRACALFRPGKNTDSESLLPCFYVNGGGDTDSLFSALDKIFSPLIKKGFPEFLMISPIESDWDSDYSPWPAELFGGRLFPGRADDYLSFLSSALIPFAEESFPIDRQKRYTMGYSLGALASFYFFLKSDLFSACACLSGSLWYPGFSEFIADNKPSSGALYLSLGKGEIKTRNALMRSSGVLHEEAASLLSSSLGAENVLFEWNNGGHGFEVPERHAKAIKWILGKTNSF